MWKIDMARTASLLILCVLGGGCYTWVPVRTTEVPLLNDMHISSLGTSTSSNGQTIAISEVSVRSVHRPDGRTVRIAGQPDIRVVTRAGTLHFDDPVISSLQPGQTLTIAGANRSAISIPLGQIEEVAVQRYSPGQTALATIGASLLGAALGTGIGFALIQ